MYQAGTLSGNPLAMAAGLAQLRELERVDDWRKLEELGNILKERILAALKRSGRNYTVQSIGSMFCLYFTEKPVSDLESAQTSDRALFAKFFNGCLERGVYFAPSQFEAGFISLAHSEADLERTGEVAAEVLQQL